MILRVPKRRKSYAARNRWRGRWEHYGRPWVDLDPTPEQVCKTKKKYRYEPEAIAAAKQVYASSGLAVVPYQCGVCGHWHHKKPGW